MTNAKQMATKTKPFYGDLVCAVAFIAVTPIDGMKAMTTCQRDPGMCHIGILSILFCIFYGGLNALAYLKHSNTISFAAFLSGLLLCGFNNYHAWPYPDEFVLVPEFQGMIVGSLVNGALTYRNKMVRFALLFAVATYVSVMSPNSVFREDVLPLLGGPILLAVIFLSWDRFQFTKSDINWNALTVYGARYLLAAIFMHHTACELLSLMNSNDHTSSVGIESYQKTHTAMDTLRTIVRASFLACVGVAATGTFQNEINLNEKLESLVQERTKEIREKNDRLHMVELALQASETAIAITDSKRKIIWLNGACEEIISVTKSMASEQNQSPVGKQLVEVLDLETVHDEKKLINAFSDTRTEDEISIRKMIYHIEVSPYAYSNSEGSSGHRNRFMVVLKNITAERAREVAEKAAREEAMLAKAMGDSMVTLTVSLVFHTV